MDAANLFFMIFKSLPRLAFAGGPCESRFLSRWRCQPPLSRVPATKRHLLAFQSGRSKRVPQPESALKGVSVTTGAGPRREFFEFRGITSPNDGVRGFEGRD